jgi:hypothetical protein
LANKQQAARQQVGTLIHAGTRSLGRSTCFRRRQAMPKMQRSCPCPTGRRGRIDMVVDVAVGDCGATRLMTRDVVTHMGSSTLHSREILALEPLKPQA